MRPPRLLPAGDSAVVVEYGEGIDPGINSTVRMLHRALSAGWHPGIIETVPTYRSVTVHYDPTVLSCQAVEELIGLIACKLPSESPEPPRTIWPER